MKWFLIIAFYRGGGVEIPFASVDACQQAVTSVYERSAQAYCINSKTGKVLGGE